MKTEYVIQIYHWRWIDKYSGNENSARRMLESWKKNDKTYENYRLIKRTITEEEIK